MICELPIQIGINLSMIHIKNTIVHLVHIFLINASSLKYSGNQQSGHPFLSDHICPVPKLLFQLVI